VTAGVDLFVFAAYLAAVVALGISLARRSGTARGFMVAGGALPGWVVGMSMFGTFLSSNTFIGVPGQAYGGNWNAFVFSLSLPVAAFLAARWWIPFYRRGDAVSAYHHLEERFGRWARTYAVACYLLTQFARVGSILFGVALAMNALTGWPVAWIVLSTGVVVTVYTLVGGIEAVIWTDVIQSVVLTIGALIVVGLLIADAQGGFGGLLETAQAAEKFSLGSFSLDFTTSTFWVVLVYGLFINFTNFGIDQSYVQRYHAANSDRAASRSVWLAAGLYLPVSAVFFFIGTGLFVVLQGQPVKDILGIHLAQDEVDHPFQSQVVVAPNGRSSLTMRFIDPFLQGNPVSAGPRDARTDADRLDELPDVQQHDVTVASTPGSQVVTMFLTLIDQHAGGMELGQVTYRIAVGDVIGVFGRADQIGGEQNVQPVRGRDCAQVAISLFRREPEEVQVGVAAKPLLVLDVAE